MGTGAFFFPLSSFARECFEEQMEITDNFADAEVPEPEVDSAPPKEEAPPPETDAANDPVEARHDLFNQSVHNSRVGIINTLTGAHSSAYNISISNNLGVAGETVQTLDAFVTFSKLDLPSRTYKSLDTSTLIGYSGCLQSERILLLSRHDENVALNIAKRIAYETKIPTKELVSVDEQVQGSYNFRNLIDSLARPKEKRRTSPGATAALCVWDPNETDEIASKILDSLLSRNTQIDHYRYWLSQRGLCLICLVSPERIHEYTDSYDTSLRTLAIDFLTPLLEHYEFDEYETLAATIRQQRVAGRWSDTDAEFYKQIIRHLKAGTLSVAVQDKAKPEALDTAKVEDLFNRQDPLVDTVLYCATFFPDLPPHDFIALVEVFVGEQTEEVTRRHSRPEQGSGNDVTETVESVPLVNRWRRDAATILAQCKLATLRDEDDKRVIDFQIDGLRDRLSQFLSTQLSYDLNFVSVRNKGLLLSPKKGIADGARQLLIDIGKESQPSEVAYWLYEIVGEFDEFDHDDEPVSRYHLVPDLTMKLARRYVSYGLSKLLIKCEKEPALREAMRLFWQKLLHNQHQWFLDLLRRMGDAAPPDTLKWLKQLLDQGVEAIRQQARSYLVNYLLHRDAIYPALKELMQWPRTTQAGRIARQALVLYCAEASRQVAQEDYGRWPSSHPLFAFQNRPEAQECLEFLIGSVYSAASEVDVDKALYIVADIVAGWYFVLSPSASEATPEFVSELNKHSDLNPGVVKNLLFECLMRYSPRAQKNALIEIWDALKNDLLDAVITVDSITASSTDAASLSDITKARRKLLDTRALLTELRNGFAESAARAASV